MFGMATRKAIADELVEQRLRHEAPPTQGNNPRSLELSLLAAKFQSLEEKTFIFVMPVKNDDGTKPHRYIAGNYVLQVIRQNAAANANRSWDIATAPALRQRTRSIKNR